MGRVPVVKLDSNGYTREFMPFRMTINRDQLKSPGALAQAIVYGIYENTVLESANLPSHFSASLLASTGKEGPFGEDGKPGTSFKIGTVISAKF